MIFTADDACLTFALESGGVGAAGEQVRVYRCLERPSITWRVQRSAAGRVETFHLDGDDRAFRSGREAVKACRQDAALDRRLMDTFPASDSVARY